jgi:hypothetical protein
MSWRLLARHFVCSHKGLREQPATVLPPELAICVERIAYYGLRTVAHDSAAHDRQSDSVTETVSWHAYTPEGDPIQRGLRHMNHKRLVFMCHAVCDDRQAPLRPVWSTL